MHQLRMSLLRPFSGWTKIPSSLPAYIYFFHLFSTLKFSLLPTPKFSLLPTTYLPVLPTIYLPPPTYHLPAPSYLPPTNPSPLTPLHSIARALEASSGSELGARAWPSRGAKAWRGERELGAGEPEQDPRRTQVSILLLFVCFFCLWSRSLCCRKNRRRRRRWQRCYRCLLLLLRVAKKKKEEEGDGSCRRLLLPAVELRCSAA